MNKLLEKARSFKNKSRRVPKSKDHLELALAWFNGELTAAQTAAGLDLKQSAGAYAQCATILRSAIADGKVTLK